MLSLTSAFVLLLTEKECYRSEQARAFFDHLDVHAGRVFVEGLRAFYDHYDVIFRYRKYAINRLLDHIFTETPDIQVVIAGAGLDPLGVDVEARYKCRVYELDVAHMDVKKKMLPHSQIVFVTVDLCQEDLVHKSLLASGWDPQKSTCLIYEGISYYVSMKTTQKLFTILDPKYIVFEYLRSHDEMNKTFRLIAKQTFDFIRKVCDMKESVTEYASEALSKIFHRPVVEKYNMCRIEHLQEEAHHYFPQEDCGWLSVVLLGESLKD